MSTDGANLIVFSLDFYFEYIQIKDEIVRRVKVPHDGAVLAGDATKNFIASVGSDGYLHIYNTKEFDIEAKH